MRPCDNCKDKKGCIIVDYLKRNYNKSPWVLNDYFCDHFLGTFIVSASIGDIDSFVLDCDKYRPTKKEINYSRLTEKTSHNCKPDKCGKCKGKCGK